MWFVIPALLTVHVGVCILLVLVVLMQLPRSEGLGAAFGGGVTENIFGAQTTNVLAKFTVWLGVAFFVITLLLAMSYSHVNAGKTRSENRLMDAPLTTAPAQAESAASPAASPAPAASAPQAEANAVAPVDEAAPSAAAPDAATTSPEPPVTVPDAPAPAPAP